MEENKRAGSYNVAESSIRYFTNSGNWILGAPTTLTGMNL